MTVLMSASDSLQLGWGRARGVSSAEVRKGQRAKSLFFCCLEEGRNRVSSAYLPSYRLAPLWKLAASAERARAGLCLF